MVEPASTRTANAIAFIAALVVLPFTGCAFLSGEEAPVREVSATLVVELPLVEPPDDTTAGEFVADMLVTEVNLLEDVESSGNLGGTIVDVRIDRIDHTIDDPNTVALVVLPMSILANADASGLANGEEVGRTKELQARGFGVQRADVTPNFRASASNIMSNGTFALGVVPRYEIPEPYNGGVGEATTRLTFDLTIIVED